MSLMDTYRELASLDEADAAAVEEEQVKEAEAGAADADVIKLAHDYEEAGRRLARVMYSNWQKVAAEGGEAEEKEEEREGLENRPKKPAPFPPKKDGEADEEKKRKKEGEGEEQMAEKKASILAQMREDPEFRARALEWFASQQS